MASEWGEEKNTCFNTKIIVLLLAMAETFSVNADNFIGKHSKCCAQTYEAFYFSITVLYNLAKSFNNIWNPIQSL
jgi:hypothetical protein